MIFSRNSKTMSGFCILRHTSMKEEKILVCHKLWKKCIRIKKLLRLKFWPVFQSKKNLFFPCHFHTLKENVLKTSTITSIGLSYLASIVIGFYLMSFYTKIGIYWTTSYYAQIILSYTSFSYFLYFPYCTPTMLHTHIIW